MAQAKKTPESLKVGDKVWVRQNNKGNKIVIAGPYEIYGVRHTEETESDKVDTYTEYKIASEWVFECDVFTDTNRFKDLLPF